jgi:hypothetical protein
MGHRRTGKKGESEWGMMNVMIREVLGKVEAVLPSPKYQGRYPRRGDFY